LPHRGGMAGRHDVVSVVLGVVRNLAGGRAPRYAWGAPMTPVPASRPRRVALLTSARSWRGSGAVFAAVARALEARGHRTTALVAREEVAREFSARALRRALRSLGAEIVFADKARDVRLAALAFPLGGPAVVYCVSTPAPPRDPLTRLACRRV